MLNNENIKIDTQTRQFIEPKFAWSYHIIPLKVTSDNVEIIVDNTYDLKKTEELEMIFNKKVVPVIVDTDTLNNLLIKNYPLNKSDDVKSFKESSDFLIKIIYEAINLNSSDIHFETMYENGRIRFRIDGKLKERYIIDKKDYPSILNKIKIKANLDISEKRLPQDGRITLKKGKDQIDIRISIMPSMHGEKAVLRILEKDVSRLDLEKLGFSQTQLKDYRQSFSKPHGIILISGPTGSGKTTTLYSTLKEINKEETNILTIEDPIEYTLNGINQVQLKESIGLSFPRALRAFLRQDPDVIMIGEIRDYDTAEIAVRSALTGHLVLSTIHTNTALGIIPRLIDMGVPPYLISSTLNVAISQRLVRILCPKCKIKKAFSGSEFPLDYKPPIQVNEQYVAVGCEECTYTGYKGRKAVYEVIPITKEISKLIRENNVESLDNNEEIKYNSISEQAFRIFAAGETSIEEIYPLLLSSIY